MSAAPAGGHITLGLMHTIDQNVPIGFQAIEARGNTSNPRRETPVSYQPPVLGRPSILSLGTGKKCLQSPALSQSKAKEGGFELRSINFITSTDAIVLFVLKQKIYFLINYRK